MAKIHKMEFYLVDCSDTYKNGESVINEIERSLYDGFIQCPTWKTSVEFEWHDDIDLNSYDCNKEECEKYFSLKQTLASMGLYKEDL